MEDSQVNSVGKGSPLQRVLIALFARPVLAVAFQSIFALVFLLSGSQEPWRRGADWWVLGITLVNITCLILLSRFMKVEHLQLRSLWRWDKTERQADLKWLALSLVVSGPLVFMPNFVIGNMLWGSAQVGADLSFRALPVWTAVGLLIVFPVTQALAELTTYFGYVMPRLEKIMQNRMVPFIITSIVLALQHVFLPLLIDWKFVIWRALMFIPFAFWVGFLIKKRPTLLPYMMIVHGFIDASLPVMILVASMA
jgi:hypothetical protein